MNKSIIISVVALVFGAVLVAIFAGKFCLFGECRNAKALKTSTEAVLQTISTQDFAQKYTEMATNGAVLLDVRTSEEFASGHYTNANNIDFYSPDFKGNLDKLDKNTQYFIYCRSGSRSGQTLQLMRGLGFTKVYDLNGGIGGAGEILPIVR